MSDLCTLLASCGRVDNVSIAWRPPRDQARRPTPQLPGQFGGGAYAPLHPPVVPPVSFLQKRLNFCKCEGPSSRLVQETRQATCDGGQKNAILYPVTALNIQESFVRTCQLFMKKASVPVIKLTGATI